VQSGCKTAVKFNLTRDLPIPLDKGTAGVCAESTTLIKLSAKRLAASAPSL